MITFTGSNISLGAGKRVEYAPSGAELHYDCTLRADGSVLAALFAFVSGEIQDSLQFAYTAAAVNAETTTETTYTGKINQAIHKLEKARLEAINPSATFTITL